jgi:hypothetical protein
MTDTIAAASAPRWPRLLLIIAAMIELLGGLQGLPVLLGDTSEVPGHDLGGAIVTAHIVLQPILALVVLLFAIRGNIPYALLALALNTVMTWMSYVPSLQLHGISFAGNLGSPGEIFASALLAWEIFLAPATALIVAALVLINKRLTWATLLAVLPTFVGALSVIAFGISVAIYGF